LAVIGSRRRKYIDEVGDAIVLVIRRLKCTACGRIHHELPDILVPYKRHASQSIEAVVEGGIATLTVTADEATLYRWRRWFRLRLHSIVGCLASLSLRLGKESVEGLLLSRLPKTTLHRIWDYVGNAAGWLARAVRPVANSNLWVHTRSAFLSDEASCRLRL